MVELSCLLFLLFFGRVLPKVPRKILPRLLLLSPFPILFPFRPVVGFRVAFVSKKLILIKKLRAGKNPVAYSTR